MTSQSAAPQGVLVTLVRQFLTSQLSLILIIFALAVGAAAILITPREEDPQIVVPLADVFVNVPGASAAEVEKLVATPLEQLLWQIDGVEYVYSISREDMALVTVRFFVGQDRENSLVKLHNKITMNQDRVPPVVQGWLIKPVEIDDVPIVNLTLYSARYDDFELRRMGEEAMARLSAVTDISRTEIVAGRKREIRVELQPERMYGLKVSLLEVARALEGADASITAGKFDRYNRRFSVTSNSFLTSAEDVAALVVGVHGGRPVYLRDIAEIMDGPEETASYSRIGFSHRYRQENGQIGAPQSFPAVTLALAKKRGTNAVWVANEILQRVAELKRTIIPEGVEVQVTRNYGHSAQQKVNGLLSSLGFAIITVIILLALTLGWREALVVALAVPISFCLALFVNYLLGFTINRVTLFALILSLGLVVDDPITNVDNIQRHIQMGKRKPLDATLFAVGEVLPPVILSTIAIIISFTPMFFITGMMGPYMAPMASTVPVTVIFSTLCALTIVPWLTHLLLKKRALGEAAAEEAPSSGANPLIDRIYRRAVSPFLGSRALRYGLLGVIVVLLVVPLLLVAGRLVPLKMLPFDNKNEFQIVVDMPEGTPLETTDAAVRQFEDYLATVAEVSNTVSYVGTASPMDFNGLVRHYYLRQGSHLADIRVNLADKARRRQQSHPIVLRLRKELEAIAEQSGAAIKLVEVPPGPPVIATITAEIYGAPSSTYDQLIQAGNYLKQQIMEPEPFVVDIDDTSETPRTKFDFVVDKEKAALHGVSTA
ncbi:MAG: efflux RND transporter permease subunit, partial [Desulfobacterales bacterium]